MQDRQKDVINDITVLLVLNFNKCVKNAKTWTLTLCVQSITVSN